MLDRKRIRCRFCNKKISGFSCDCEGFQNFRKRQSKRNMEKILEKREKAKAQLAS